MMIRTATAQKKRTHHFRATHHHDMTMSFMNERKEEERLLGSSSRQKWRKSPFEAFEAARRLIEYFSVKVPTQPNLIIKQTI